MSALNGLYCSDIVLLVSFEHVRHMKNISFQHNEKPTGHAERTNSPADQAKYYSKLLKLDGQQTSFGVSN